MESKVIEIEHIRLTFWNTDDIVGVHYKTPGKLVDVAIVKEYHQLITEELKGGSAYLLITGEVGVQLTEEARDWVASDHYGVIAKADAIVASNFNHEMAANFFIRFQNSNRPVKLFPNTSEASQWIEILKKSVRKD